MTTLVHRYGHQEAVTALSCFTDERCVTVGGRDRTSRLWKIPEESQLVFKIEQAEVAKGCGSLESCTMLSKDTWVVGSDHGYYHS